LYFIRAPSKTLPHLGINAGNKTNGANTAPKINQAPVMSGAKQPSQNPSKPTNTSNQKIQQATKPGGLETSKPKAAAAAVRPGKNASQTDEDKKPAGAEGLLKREVYLPRNFLSMKKHDDHPGPISGGGKTSMVQSTDKQGPSGGVEGSSGGGDGNNNLRKNNANLSGGSVNTKPGDKNHPSEANADKKLDGFSGGLKRRKMMSKMGGGGMPSMGGGMPSMGGGGMPGGGGGGLKSMMGGAGGGMPSMGGGGMPGGGGGGLKSMMGGAGGGSPGGGMPSKGGGGGLKSMMGGAGGGSPGGGMGGLKSMMDGAGGASAGA
jgi:hypothetical protein